MMFKKKIKCFLDLINLSLTFRYLTSLHLCEVQKRVLYYQICFPQRYLRSGKSSKRTSTDKLSRWAFLNVLLNPLKLILEDTRQHRNDQQDKYKGNNIMLQASHPLQISNYIFRFASYRSA